MEKDLILASKQLELKEGKRANKSISILIGLVDLFSKLRKPISSNMLKEELFPKLSSATIRNHLFDLESCGYLRQLHTSGGREPTDKAISFYCKAFINDLDCKSKKRELFPEIEEIFAEHGQNKFQEKADLNSIFEFLMSNITRITGCVGIVSVPSFEQDCVAYIKIVRINVRRVLAVIITQFGFVDTETLYVNQDLSEDQAMNIQLYIKTLISGIDYQQNLSKQMQDLAKDIYSELSVRYVIKKNASFDDAIIKSGLNQLAKSCNFFDSDSINDVINIVENRPVVNSILSYVRSSNSFSALVGNEISSFLNKIDNICIFGCPYMLKNLTVGSIILIAPKNCIFKRIISLLKAFQEKVSMMLEDCVVKLKIDLKSFCLNAKNSLSKLDNLTSHINE